MNAVTQSRDVSQPTPGHFKLRLVRGGPFVAAAISHQMGFWAVWINGEPCGARHPDPWAVDGCGAAMERVWTHGIPIENAEYQALLLNPPILPGQKIDIGAMPPITFRNEERPPMNAISMIGHNGAPTIDLAAALEPEALGAWIAGRLAAHTERAGMLLAGFRLSSPIIANDNVADRATDFVRQVKGAISETDGERVRIKAPVLAAQRAIDGAAKAITDPLQAASVECERRVTVFMVEKDRAARLAAAENAARAAEAAALLIDEAMATDNPDIVEQAAEAEIEQWTAEAIVHAPTAELTRLRTTNGGTAGLRDNWIYEIANISDVPAHFLMINDAAVKAAIKGGSRNIPGLTIRNQPKVGIR